jgi:hypothetical protein
MLTTEYAMTRGHSRILHLRFPNALLTICGYRVDTRRTEYGSAATTCPRCKQFVT